MDGLCYVGLDGLRGVGFWYLVGVCGDIVISIVMLLMLVNLVCE